MVLFNKNKEALQISSIQVYILYKYKINFSSPCSVLRLILFTKKCHNNSISIHAHMDGLPSSLYHWLVETVPALSTSTHFIYFPLGYRCHSSAEGTHLTMVLITSCLKLILFHCVSRKAEHSHWHKDLLLINSTCHCSGFRACSHFKLWSTSCQLGTKPSHTKIKIKISSFTSKFIHFVLD